MLPEVLTALASAGGLAVVQAAGTDAWVGLRGSVARVLGRGEPQREQAELERLDRTARDLQESAGGQLERAKILQEGSWQARFEDLLERAEPEERERIAEELRLVLSDYESASASGRSWHGDVRQQATASDEARVYQVGQGDMRISDS